MAKLNQGELDAVTWRIIHELREIHGLAIKAAQDKARKKFESDIKLCHAHDILKSGQRLHQYKMEITFSHPKIADVPPHYEIKNRLIISQIASSNLSQVIKDLTKEIADEISL